MFFLCPLLTQRPSFFQLYYSFLAVKRFVYLLLPYCPFRLFMLLFCRLPYGEVFLNQLFLQGVPFRYGCIMMFEDFEPIFKLIYLLLGETLDVTRFEHLDTLVIFVENNTALSMPGSLAVFWVLAQLEFFGA